MQCALLDRVREQPGGEALLGAAFEGVHLVGGAVRDLLRAERPRELEAAHTSCHYDIRHDQLYRRIALE